MLDRATLDANGGNQTIWFQVGATGTSDVDTVFIHVTCFATGTSIATPCGDRAVETLRAGDLVRTADGRDVAVRWIGRQTVSTLFANTDRLRLVRIAKGALGQGLPARDLRVTADHAMLADGMLVSAGALVNGTTVTFVPLAELGTGFTVWHVEGDAPELILAEGAATESFMDYVGRQVFDNHAEADTDRRMTEMPLPRIDSARLLPAPLRARLAGAQAASDRPVTGAVRGCRSTLPSP